MFQQQTMTSYASGIDGCRRQMKYDHPNYQNLKMNIYAPLNKLRLFQIKRL